MLRDKEMWYHDTRRSLLLTHFESHIPQSGRINSLVQETVVIDGSEGIQGRERDGEVRRLRPPGVHFSSRSSPGRSVVVRAHNPKPTYSSH